MKIDKGSLVFASDGTIDVSGSVAVFAAELEEFARFENESTGEVLSALNQVWAKFPAARMNQKFIVGEALRNLGDKVTPKTHGLYEEKTLDMIAALAERGIVEVKKGRDGGTKYLGEPKA